VVAVVVGESARAERTAKSVLAANRLARTESNR